MMRLLGTLCLLICVGVAVETGRAAPAPAAPAAATVEYTIRGAEAPHPGLTLDDQAPWLGWGGKLLQASWQPINAQLTLYLPDAGGQSLCPLGVTCYPVPVTYRFVQGWTALTVLEWAPTVPWYFGYAGTQVPYTVAGDRVILQLPPQAAP